MRPILLALAALLLWPLAALADIRDDVTALIRAGDQAAILKALANPDPAMQRKSFAAFATSRSDVAALSAAMLAAHPDDPHAMVARGWYLQARGWAMRGQASVRDTAPQSLEAMADLHAQGYALAEAALTVDPGLFPASDLVLSLSRTTGRRAFIPSELDRAMAIWPNRQTMMLAIGGMTPNWGGPKGWGYDVCAAYADRIADVADYTQAVCEVDILFSAGYPDGYGEMVFDRIPGLDHPILDDARTLRAMSGRIPPAEAIAWLEGRLAVGELRLQPAQYLDDLRGLGQPVIGGPAVAQVIDEAVESLRADIDFNPADAHALERYAVALGILSELRHTPFPRDEIITRYAARFALAPYDGKTWADFADLMAGGLDWNDLDLDRVSDVRRFYENGVAWTNHSTQSLRELDNFNRTVWQWLDQHMMTTPARTTPKGIDPARFDALVVCPAVRSIRMLTAVCEGGPGRLVCPDTDDPSDPAYLLLTRAIERGVCEGELQTDLTALAYQPRPVTLPPGG